MKLQFVGIIRYPFLRNLLFSKDYRSHSITGRIYTLRMAKNTFKLIPRSVVYYNVFIVRGESCAETESNPIEIPA